MTTLFQESQPKSTMGMAGMPRNWYHKLQNHPAQMFI
uniref:Uncharacterized protein n=1 Tax=Rhizophora mucronata TaxID=61149 RepID=A0A2P2N2Z5_RHIMU